MTKPLIKRARNFALYLIIQLLRGVFFLIPWQARVSVGSALGALARVAMKKHRDIILKNIGIAYGDKFDAAAKQKLLKENFRHYGISVFEFIKCSTMSGEKAAALVTEFEGAQYLDEAKAAGKGVIAVTAHLGNWEILPLFIAVSGYKAGAVGKKLFDGRLDRIVNGSRQRLGVMIFDRDSAPISMIKELKKGMVLGLLVDQDTKVDSVFVPFLGKEAKTPSAPAIMAKKFGYPLATVFITRKPDGKYKVMVNKPIEIKETDTVEAVAAAYNKEISDAIYAHPEQWVWLHDRWKTPKNA